MKKIITLLAITLFFVSRVAATPYDHIHLIAPNALDAVNWYVKHFGGEATRFRRSTDTSLPIDRVAYGDISVIFFERESSGGSVGTGADHISFSMANVAEVVAGVVADGGT